MPGVAVVSRDSAGQPVGPVPALETAGLFWLEACAVSIISTARRNPHLRSLRDLEIGYRGWRIRSFILTPGPDFGSCLMLAKVNKNSQASAGQRRGDSLGPQQCRREPLRHCLRDWDVSTTLVASSAKLYRVTSAARTPKQ